MCVRRTMPPMTLSQWIAKEGVSMADFGQRVCASHSTVSRLCSGKLRPSMSLMERILKATGGDVTPNDFLPDGVAERAAG